MNYMYVQIKYHWFMIVKQDYKPIIKHWISFNPPNFVVNLDQVGVNELRL